jgi:multiple sugar transport system substrate-binding protein
VSIYISHTLSPPGAINPSSNLKSLTGQIRDALESKGLIP